MAEELKFGLEKFGDYDQPFSMSFTAVKYSNKQALRAIGGGKLIDIHLPMPRNINANNSITYGTGQTETTGGLFDPTTAGVGESVKNWLTGGTWWKDMSGYSALMGKRPMDERDSIFRGAGFRTHSYAWRLIPKSKAEAKVVKEIASAFQRMAYPSKTGLESYSRVIHPPVWHITGMSSLGSEHAMKEWTMNPLPSVLQSVKVVTAGASGLPGVYTIGGYPAATSISVAFLELEPAINDGDRLKSRSQLRMTNV